MSETDAHGTDHALEAPDDVLEAEPGDRAEIDVEAPEADAAEQRRALHEDETAETAAEVPAEAPEADAAEQRRVVELDEDDYR